MIIGITGTIGSGKGAVVEYLKKNHNFSHYSVRSVLVDELNGRGMELSRDNMIKIANEFRTRSPGFLMELLLSKAIKNGGDAVIESVRTIGELETLRNKAHKFCLLAVEADPKIRYERLVKRGSSTDHITFEKFLKDDERENYIAGCIALADFKLTNNTDFKDFYDQVDKILLKILVA